MQRTSVYVGTADPDLQLGSTRLRQLLALQSLLFACPVLQDNFLLSRQAFEMSTSDSLLPDLLANGSAAIAMRRGVHGPAELALELARRVQAGTYVPFPGDSAALYESQEFQRYSHNLERARDEAGTQITWTPSELGVLYRAKMEQAAVAGEWGGNPEPLLAAFDAVEHSVRAVNRSGHSCSDYYNAADRLFTDVRNSYVKAWARSYYLTNLPDACDIASWIPSNLLAAHKRRDEFSALEWKDSTTDFELGAGLFNLHFLQHVPSAAIIELRKEDSFKMLQAAVNRGDRVGAEYAFSHYKTVVYGRAAELVPESRTKVQSSDAKAKELRQFKDYVSIPHRCCL
jgi:hypothetical protein